MTAAPNSTLVAKVARAIHSNHAGQGWEPIDFVPNWIRRDAEAAIAACHVAELESALRDLLEDTQHRAHDCGDSLEHCPVLRAHALLAKLDGRQ